MHVVLVYLQPFWCNSLLKCVSQPEIAKNSLKPPILKVQGHSRSLMLTFLSSSLPLLVMINSMYVPICNHFHVRRANCGKITLLQEVSLFRPLFVETPFTQQHEILSRNTRKSRLSYGENPNSLSHLGLNWYWVMTDGQTDGGQNYRS